MSSTSNPYSLPHYDFLYESEKFSIRHRIKLSVAKKGKPRPDSVRRKISAKMSGKSNHEGKKHSSKAKQNISDGRGNYDPIKGKKWYVTKSSGKTYRKERNPSEVIYQHGRIVRKGKGLPESFMSFSNYIIEGRDADLFHGTSIDSVHSILKDGHIKASSDNNHVSLSRSEDHAKEHSMGEAYFKINQRTLSHTHKITPTDWHMGGSIKGSERHDDWSRDKENRRSESEEAVKGNIPLKHAHTLVINKKEHDRMSPEKREELHGHLKRHNIKLERKDF